MERGWRQRNPAALLHDPTAKPVSGLLRIQPVFPIEFLGRYNMLHSANAAVKVLVSSYNTVGSTFSRSDIAFIKFLLLIGPYWQDGLRVHQQGCDEIESQHRPESTEDEENYCNDSCPEKGKIEIP